jgi:hypothetical protein
MFRVAIVVVLAACRGGQEPPAPPAPTPTPAPERSRDDRHDRERPLVDGARGLADRARSLGDDVADQATAIVGDTVDRTVAAVAKAGRLTTEAVAAGRRLQAALRDTRALAGLDYDLAIETFDEAEAQHRARLLFMNEIQLGATRIGWTRHTSHQLGSVYRWQFKIAWHIPATQRSIRLLLFTNHDLPEVDLGDALAIIVPLAARLFL